MRGLWLLVPAIALGGCSCSFHAGTGDGNTADATATVATPDTAATPANAAKPAGDATENAEAPPKGA